MQQARAPGGETDGHLVLAGMLSQSLQGLHTACRNSARSHTSSSDSSNSKAKLSD